MGNYSLSNSNIATWQAAAWPLVSQKIRGNNLHQTRIWSEKVAARGWKESEAPTGPLKLLGQTQAGTPAPQLALHKGLTQLGTAWSGREEP